MSSYPDFTLHTEPIVSPPEFTITCQTQGGPATTVDWVLNSRFIGLEESDYEFSQVIVDTSHNSVYKNRLRVRGRKNGTYYCVITSGIVNYFSEVGGYTVDGMLVEGSTFYHFSSLYFYDPHLYSCRRAHQPLGCHLSVQQYTCQYYCVLGVTRWSCHWLCDLLPV